MTAWRLNDAVFVQGIDLSVEDNSLQSVFFRADGLKMYTVGSSNRRVYEYDLSTPFNIATVVFLQSFSVSAQDTTPSSLFFKPDGTKMYVTGGTGDDINEYDLSTPWDISTSVFLQNIAVGDNPQGCFFTADGTKMFISRVGAGAGVQRYDLSTPWSVVTAVANGGTLVGISSPQGIFMNPEGTKLYVVNGTPDTVIQYNLSTANDLSTATAVFTLDVSGIDSVLSGLFISPTGLQLWVAGFNDDEITEYSLATLFKPECIIC